MAELATTNELTDVAFVAMPFAGLDRPSLALGLLKAELERNAIRTRVHYESLHFAEEVGSVPYVWVAGSDPMKMLGEWVFAKVLFPDLEDRVGSLMDVPELSQYEPRLLPMRVRAEHFIQQAAERILAGGTRIVGCTSTFAQNCASLSLLRRIKEIDPSVVTMMGGGNCEGVQAEALVQLFPFLDCVVSGEADDLITPLCQGLLAEGADFLDRPQPEGVVTRKWSLAAEAGDPALKDRPRRAVVDKLDELPIPDYSEYFAELESSRVRVRPGLVVEGSRGCWWGAKVLCTFCGLNGEGIRYRSKSPGRFLAELDTLAEKWGFRRFEAVDNILPKDYAAEVFQDLAQRDQKWSIFYEIKADLSLEEFTILRDAGVKWLQPGIETLSQTSLKRMRKGTNVLQNLQTLKWAQQFGMFLSWNMLVGFPGETEEDYREINEILPLIEHLQPPTGSTGSNPGLVPIRFDLYGYYYRQREALGLEFRPADNYRYIYPFEESDRAKLSYYFETDATRGAFDSEEFKKLSESMSSWAASLRLSTSRPGARLEIVEESAGVLRIVDSRKTRTQDEHRISGLAARILLACEEMKTRAKLIEILGEEGWSGDEEQLETALDDLAERKLVVLQNRWILALVLKTPLSPKIDPEDCPSGMVLRELKPIEDPFQQNILDAYMFRQPAAPST